VVVDPDNQQSVLLGPVTDSNSFGGGHGETTIGYWPRQNGEFTFRIIRIDGNSETLLAERRIATDKAAIMAPPVPSGSTRDGQFAVTGLRTIPEQLVVGQSVTIEVAVTNSSALPVSQTVPVVLSDDFGDQTLAIGSFTLDAGLSGTGEVSWVPDRTTVGALKAGDQILPIVVTDGVPTSGPIQSDQSESFDSPTEGAAGD